MYAHQPEGGDGRSLRSCERRRDDPDLLRGCSRLLTDQRDKEDKRQEGRRLCACVV